MSAKTQEMTLVQHLLELRDKLLRSVIAILLIFIAIFPFSNEIYAFIAEPIISVLPADSNIIAIGVISPFLTPLKMALIFAVYLAMPYLLYQIWSFVAPALYSHEKQMILPLVISSTLLFYAGILFSFYLVFPVIFGFLSAVGPSVVDFTPDIQYYLDFVLKVSFAFGVAFEVPIATILLIVFGVVSPQKLKKNRPYIIVAAFVLGMLLTPPDVISQILIALPMWLLFEAGLFFAPLFKPRQARKNSTNEDADDIDDVDTEAQMDKVDAEMEAFNKEKD